MHVPTSPALLLLPLLGLTVVHAQSSCSPAPAGCSALPSCAAFRACDSTISASLTSLCTQMDGMPGCSIRKACDENDHIPDPYCTPMSLLANICSADMPTMADCRSYVQQCGNATTAANGLNTQCKEPASQPIPALPTSKTTTQHIYSICTEMAMPGCERCTITSPTATYASCDLLDTYSLLCKAMPDMAQCADWKAMCAATPGLSYCSSHSHDDPPVMQMFFHTGLADYVLFQKWVPRTPLQYAGTWLVIFLFGILYEGWNAWIATSEANLLSRTAKHHDTTTAKTSKNGLIPITPSPPRALTTWTIRFKRGLFRAMAKAITVTAAYFLMLVAMTFNVGLFIAVVAGLAVGSAIFTEWTRAAVKAAVLNEANSDELCC
ncbi:hypothetical protein PhCBS80983_g03618 [Powellomyces hirtus]|uniref:Copper transport protein n=1 Tax=Powellomyces hirtus TaxID=109895 RepID=A0A507E0R5_9FUNG|nr:hypothetical protein PhCBS80983_g03618 [Powellomyces hirtus]